MPETAEANSMASGAAVADLLIAVAISGEPRLIAGLEPDETLLCDASFLELFGYVWHVELSFDFLWLLTEIRIVS